MPQYQILTCPNCNGKGCPTCQNTGKVRVAQEQVNKLKQLMKQLPQNSPQPQPSQFPQTQSSLSQFNPTKAKINTSLAGIIAFSLLSILAGGATASWYFLKTLKPFFAGLIILLSLIGTRIAWTKPFFQLQQPNDFLKAIKKT